MCLSKNCSLDVTIAERAYDQALWDMLFKLSLRKFIMLPLAMSAVITR